MHYLCSPNKELEILIKIYCGVEQLVARWAHNPKVTGSSPVPATLKNRQLQEKATAFSFLPKTYLKQFLFYQHRLKRLNSIPLRQTNIRFFLLIFHYHV